MYEKLLKKKKINKFKIYNLYIDDYILDLLGYNPDRPTEVINFRFIVLVLFLIGVIFIVIELTKYIMNVLKKIEYKCYLNFKEEQNHLSQLMIFMDLCLINISMGWSVY